MQDQNAARPSNSVRTFATQSIVGNYLGYAALGRLRICYFTALTSIKGIDDGSGGGDGGGRTADRESGHR